MRGGCLAPPRTAVVSEGGPAGRQNPGREWTNIPLLRKAQEEFSTALFFGIARRGKCLIFAREIGKGGARRRRAGSPKQEGLGWVYPLGDDAARRPWSSPAGALVGARLLSRCYPGEAGHRFSIDFAGVSAGRHVFAYHARSCAAPRRPHVPCCAPPRSFSGTPPGPIPSAGLGGEERESSTPSAQCIVA
jgi:hypothetical protein